MAANSIEIIRRKIIDEAKAFEAETLADAESKAKAQKEEFDAKAKETKETLIAQAKEKAQSVLSGAESSGDMQNRNAKLELKVELIEKAFSKALDKLINSPEDEYCSFFAARLREALIPGKAGVITTNARDAGERTQKILALAGAVDIVPAKYTNDIAGGFILTYDDIHLCFSAEKMLDALKGELETEAAGLLFGKD